MARGTEHSKLGRWSLRLSLFFGVVFLLGFAIVCPGRIGVGDSRDATAKAQKAVCDIGRLRERSGPRDCLLRLVGAILTSRGYTLTLT